MQYETPCPLHDARRRRKNGFRLALAATLLSALALALTIAIYAATDPGPPFARTTDQPIAP